MLKIIYPLLKLLRLNEERRSWLLSNGRRHGRASYRALWKEGECDAHGVLNAFLGATCERPHETQKGKKTKTKVQKKENKEQSMYVNISLNFF